MGDSKISEFIEEFLFAKEIEEGCASSTIKAYQYDLQKFFNIVGDIGVTSPFLRQKIRLFLKKLKEKNYSKKAIARKIATLRSFFKFLMVNELIIKNPMDKIQSPKIRTEENLPKFLDISDIKKIFTTLKDEKQLNSEKSQRQYLIVRVLYSTMARVSELCNIKIKDVDFEHGYIRLRGKSNKERIVPVDDNTLDFIKEYLQNRIFYDSDDFLLVNTRRQKLNPRVVQEDVQNIKKKMWISRFKDYYTSRV